MSRMVTVGREVVREITAQSVGEYQSANMPSEPHPNGLRSVAPVCQHSPLDPCLATTMSAREGVRQKRHEATAGGSDNGPLSRPSASVRAVMVLLSTHDLPPAQIAALLDCHPATVRRWISRFNDEGRPGWPIGPVLAASAGRAAANRADCRASSAPGSVGPSADPPLPGLAAAQYADAVPARTPGTTFPTIFDCRNVRTDAACQPLEACQMRAARTRKQGWPLPPTASAMQRRSTMPLRVSGSTEQGGLRPPSLADFPNGSCGDASGLLTR